MKTILALPFISKLQENLTLNNGLLQVILGPRQVGKTTTILKFLESLPNQSHYISADTVFNASSSWLIENWQLAEKGNKLLVIDEIQKCENWSEIIKKLWDDSKKRKSKISCILLGSSSLQIQKGLTESLTGRFQLIYAYHWNYSESNFSYDLKFDQFLKFGGYPGSYHLINSEVWANYVKGSIISTVIEKDILQYHTVKSPSLFKQAFEILISYPAQEISYTKLLGQLQNKGNVELIKYYIALYEGSFLIRALEKFSNKKLKIKSSSPKIITLAPCLYYLNVLDEFSSDEKGRAFETLVGAQLCRTQAELYYWREGKYEVDFVLKKGRRVWAIEVKSGRKKSTQGLEVFCQNFKNSIAVIITPDNYFEFEKDPIVFLEK